jgi:hypothetical protein
MLLESSTKKTVPPKRLNNTLFFRTTEQDISQPSLDRSLTRQQGKGGASSISRATTNLIDIQA